MENRGLPFGDVVTLLWIDRPAGKVHQFQLVLKVEHNAVPGLVFCGAFKLRQGLQRKSKLFQELLCGLFLDGLGQIKGGLDSFFDAGVVRIFRRSRHVGTDRVQVHIGHATE